MPEGTSLTRTFGAVKPGTGKEQETVFRAEPPRGRSLELKPENLPEPERETENRPVAETLDGIVQKPVFQSGQRPESRLVLKPDQHEPEAELEDAYCSLTNRIVLVSPLPQKLHELIGGLTAACYDVMVFHHGDPSLPARLSADLLIVDCTVPVDGGGRYEWLASPELAHTPIVRLLPDGASGDNSGTALVWPAPFPQALTVIRSAAEAGRSAPKGMEQTEGLATAGSSGASAGPDAASAAASAESMLRLHDLVLDLKRYSAVKNGTRLELTKTEFDLLRVLLQAGGSVLTRQELMDQVWGDDYYGGSNTVDVHVKTLRQKLNDDPKTPRYIATVRGIGYRAADGS
jgi:two-component system, OmpR family, alkaline phosphatase synthesis response regulator PhoP